MKIRFRTRKLEKQYRSHREAEKAYGRIVARKFIQRIEIIKLARDIDEVRVCLACDATCSKAAGKANGP
jgi:proteic killer suppression protein